MENLIVSLGVEEKKGVPVVSSRKVAEVFGKEHHNVIRDIEICRGELKNEPSSMYFIKHHYYSSQSKPLPEYLLTRDGFTLLAMGFTGEKAMKFKIAYIQAFNSMEKKLTEHGNLRKKSIKARNMFTDCLQAHGYNKPYEYIQTTKQMKAVLGVENNKDKMTDSELKLITACELISQLNIERAGAIGYNAVNPLCLKSSVAVANAVNPALVGRI